MREQTLPAEVQAPAGGKPQWQRWIGPATGVALLLAMGWFLATRARKIDWHNVGHVLLAYPLGTLVLAVLAATASHGFYASYDLLARRYLGHQVAPLKVAAVGLVSYAFNLNLGSLVGGIGLRWRLYSRLGLDAAQTGRIFAFSLIANWSGYSLLAGLLLASGAFVPPPPLRLPSLLMQASGMLLLLAPLLYVLWCATAKKRRAIAWRNHRFEFPKGGAATWQVALSTCHWSLAAVTVWLLMPHGLPFPTVLGTLLTAAVAGAAIHVPGGLGVIEAVFVATLSSRVPEGQLIAALLAYRAAYYLLPLAGATALHLGLEAHARKRPEGE